MVCAATLPVPFQRVALLSALLLSANCHGSSADGMQPTREDAVQNDDAETHSDEAGPMDAEPPASAGDAATDANTLSSSNADSAADTTIDAGPPLRVLFVGNSYTEVNDLPAVVAALGAATRAPGIDVEAITLGGATLADHWTKTGARERIASGAFQTVVMQGQSQEPYLNAAGFDQHAKLFADALRDAGAHGVWFSTWAPRNVEGDAKLLTEAIELRYRTAASLHADLVARVGAAWQIALLALPNVTLYAPDGSHPSTAGTLLTGCVIAQALLGETPRMPSPPPLGVASDVAERLCSIAEAGVRCNAGQSFCSDQCVAWDIHNCGGCGMQCQPGDPCRRGVCGCEPSLTGCSERCTDLRADAENCGKCGFACPFGAVCRDSACSCPLTGRYAITPSDLSVRAPECSSWDGRLACGAASHTLCTELGGELQCFNSGFGPPSGHAPRQDAVMCVNGAIRTAPFTALRAFVPACDGTGERAGPNCVSAIHRFCAAAGAVSGFGPIDADSGGDALRVTCLANAALLNTSAEMLRQQVSRCTSADAITCSAAAWNLCESKGYTAGFGPVDASGDDRVVVCVGP